MNTKKNVPSTTESPKDITTPASPTPAPSIISIEDDFRINEIPNSTHFNVDYKYSFVLVANNKKKASVNSSNAPAMSKESDKSLGGDNETVTERDLIAVLNATTTPTNVTNILEKVTPGYDFLTEQPETKTNSEEMDGSTSDPDVDYENEINNIIESRSKRHKGKSKVIKDNHATVTYKPDSWTVPSATVTTEISGSLGAPPSPTTQGETSRTDKQTPAQNNSTASNHLSTFTTANISQDLFAELNSTSNSSLLNSVAENNGTEPLLNGSSPIYWIVGNWSEVRIKFC